MSDYSFSDLVAAMGNRDGFGSGIWIVLILVFFLFGGGAWGTRQGEFSTFAQASQANEILLGQKFDALDNKMDRGFTSIGNGLSDLGYALTQNITNEGRNTQMMITNGNTAIMTAIRDDGEKTRALINANEMQRIRDERDYYRGMWGQRQESDRILGVQGTYYNNAPCGDNRCC